MLELRRLSKSFGSFTALRDFDFAVRSGEIVGLLGENGAGKSTPIGLISGNLSPTSGEILWNDAPVRFASPRDATAAGIGVVHQHFRLVSVFSIAENLALSGQRAGWEFNLRKWEDRVADWADRLGWKIDPRARIQSLSVGERQRVEILKALFAGDESAGDENGAGARLLLLDEPTANLAPPETRELFGVLRRLRDEGRGVVFVSHKLDEVMALCDRVVLLRRGERVGERAVQSTSTTELGALMVGREIEGGFNRAKSVANSFEGAPKVLCIENLHAKGLHDFNLSVCAGEMVALAGVDGNGQQELAAVLAGLLPPDRGRIWIEEDALAMIPPDRQSSGLILSFDLAENMALHPALRAQCRRRFGFDWQGARAKTRELMARFDVRAPNNSERALAANLSGGNQQKLLVARALSFPHRVVVAVDPTRGLDIGASAFVHAQLRAAAQNGAGVLLISSDLDECLSLGDSIGVLYEGRLLPHEKLLPAGTSREIVGALMGGAVVA